MIDDSEIHGVRDRVLMLRSLETLSGLQDVDLSVLAERMRLRYLEPGDVLFTEADIIEKLYFILEGTIRVERDGGAAVGVLHRGMVAGFFAALAGDHRGVEATVQEPTTAFELSLEVFVRALNRFPALMRHFIRLTADGLLVSRGYLPRDDKRATDSVPTIASRERTLAERILAFSQSASVLTSASLSALFEVVFQADEVRIPAGELLWQEGDPSTTTLAIDGGRVRCTCAAGDESEVRAPFLLGELDTLAGVPRPYSAVAETDLLALRIPRETFYSVVEAHPDVGTVLLSRLSADLLKFGWAGLGSFARAV